MPVAAAPGVAAGMLFVTGAGDSRFFPSAGSGGYTSPAEDFGTLAQNPDGSYAYTAKDQTKEDFNSSGQLTAVVDTHALTLQATCHVEGIPRGQLRGYLPLSYPKGMSGFLYRHKVLWKTFPLSR